MSKYSILTAFSLIALVALTAPVSAFAAGNSALGHCEAYADRMISVQFRDYDEIEQNAYAYYKDKFTRACLENQTAAASEGQAKVNPVAAYDFSLN